MSTATATINPSPAAAAPDFTRILLDRIRHIDEVISVNRSFVHHNYDVAGGHCACAGCLVRGGHLTFEQAREGLGLAGFTTYSVCAGCYCPVRDQTTVPGRGLRCYGCRVWGEDMDSVVRPDAPAPAPRVKSAEPAIEMPVELCATCGTPHEARHLTVGGRQCPNCRTKKFIKLDVDGVCYCCEKAPKVAYYGDVCAECAAFMDDQGGEAAA